MSTFATREAATAEAQRRMRAGLGEQTIRKFSDGTWDIVPTAQPAANDPIAKPKSNGAAVKPNGTVEPKAAKASAAPSPLRVLDAGEFAAGKPLSWVVKGVIPAESVCVIYGQWGSGKSFLAYDLAGAVTRGLSSWCEHRVKRGAAVVVCAEGQAGARTRTKAYAQRFNCKFEDMPGVISASPNLLEKDAQDAVLVELKAYAKRKGGLLLVIVDTKSAVTAGMNENASEQISVLIDYCKRVKEETGSAVVLIDHTGATNADRPRGHTQLSGAVDLQIRVEREGEARTWLIQKLKDGRDGEAQGFRLVPVVVETDEDGDLVTSCVVEHLGTQRPANTEVERTHQLVQWWINTGREPFTETCVIKAKRAGIWRGKFSESAARQLFARLVAVETVVLSDVKRRGGGTFYTIKDTQAADLLAKATRAVQASEAEFEEQRHDR